MDSTIHGPTTNRRQHVLMAAVFSLLAACDAAKVDSVSAAPGNYTANAINGLSLPYRVGNSTHWILIASASASMFANRRYEIGADGTKDGIAGPIFRDNGSYSVSGSTITFSSAVFALQYTATVAAGTYSVEIPGILVSSTAELHLQLDRDITAKQPPDTGDTSKLGHTPL
jgi:hypothetical protein